jgi:hypothetical protein
MIPFPTHVLARQAESTRPDALSVQLLTQSSLLLFFALDK